MNRFIKKIRKEYDPMIGQLLIEYRVEALQELEDAQKEVDSLETLVDEYFNVDIE